MRMHPLETNRETPKNKKGEKMSTQTKPKDTKALALVRKTALSLLSERLNVPAEQLRTTLKATAFNACRNNDDEFLSAVIVANEYKLNPFTKEIYAFPAKNGGVIPIVSTDGWNKLMTTHPDYKSHEYNFADEQETMEGAKPAPVWCEVIIHKQDGSKITVREYLDEVYRPAIVKEGRKIDGPWQTHTKRMLRHKAKIQCAREAFGFGGIYDEDEGKRIIEAEARLVPEAIDPPKSISGQDARSETRTDAKPQETVQQVKEDDRKAHKWSEDLEKFRVALGDGEFYSVLAWHNVNKPEDLENVERTAIIADLKKSVEAKAK